MQRRAVLAAWYLKFAVDVFGCIGSGYGLSASFRIWRASAASPFFDKLRHTSEISIAVHGGLIIFWFFMAWVAARAILRIRKSRQGYCENRGYDLRASPHRCPECGTLSTRAKVG